MSNELQTKLDAILLDKNTNLLPENLKAGVTCLGIEGILESGSNNIDVPEFTPDTEDVSSEYIETSIARTDDDTQMIGIKGDVLKDFLVREGSFIRGEIPYADAARMLGVTPDVLTKGTTILGVEGIADANGIDTSDATATITDIANGKIAYVNGEKITGVLPTMSNHTFLEGSSVSNYAGTDVSKIRLTALYTGEKAILRAPSEISINMLKSEVAQTVGLTADKIVSGNTILGVEGTAMTGGLDTSDATAVVTDVIAGKTAYVNGEKITGELEITTNHEFGPEGTLGSWYDGMEYDLTSYTNYISNNKWVLTYSPVIDEYYLITTSRNIMAEPQSNGGIVWSGTNGTTGNLYGSMAGITVRGYNKTTQTFNSTTTNYGYQTWSSGADTMILANGSNIYRPTSASTAVIHQGPTELYQGELLGMSITNTMYKRITVEAAGKVVQHITNENLAEFIGLTADIIKKGVTILGITGTYEPNYEELGTVTPEEYTEAQTQISDLFGEEETE